MRVVRLCSVFEPPPAVLAGRGVRFDPIGGMQNHTASLTRALDARGLSQDVVTARPPGAPWRQRLGDRAVVHRLGLPMRPLRQLYSLPAAPLVVHLARRATLVHAHLGEDLAIVPMALVAARRARVPLVLTIHCSLVHTLAGGGLRGAILRHAGGRLEHVGARAADAVIALTPRLAELLAADGIRAERIRVIPSGVVQADFDTAGGDALASIGRPRVVYVGRLAPQKGVRYLVEAAARLHTAGAQLCIVGDGRDRRGLQHLARRLGIGDRVHFLGFRPHEEIPGVLAGTDVLVLPSVYEELGSVLLEGLQVGVPIVASDSGGIPDALGDAGVLVPPRDPAALAAAVDRLLEDAKLRATLSRRARRRAPQYDWELLADRVLDVYRAITGEAPRRASVPAPPAAGVRAGGSG